MKTPEQMAEEYRKVWGDEQLYKIRHEHKRFDWDDALIDGFLAGYQAAKDQLADAGKVMSEMEQLAEVLYADMPMAKKAFLRGYRETKEKLNVSSSQWISVKDRLPEFTEGWCIVYGANTGWRWMVQPAYYDAHKEEWMSRFIKHRSEIAVDGKLTEWIEYLPLEDVTHWMPLPEAPKGEG